MQCQCKGIGALFPSAAEQHLVGRLYEQKKSRAIGATT